MLSCFELFIDCFVRASEGGAGFSREPFNCGKRCKLFMNAFEAIKFKVSSADRYFFG